jgi:histidinol phosphatase-like PHP family hydrolase
MYDLHTHSVFSDGELIPAESARRAQAAGYCGIAITDHADASNLLWIIENQLKFKESFNRYNKNFKVIIGVELTHVLPEEINTLSEKARNYGADIILVHGETVVEPVLKNTNIAAIEAGVDILAHPGLVTDEEIKLAIKNNVYMELTTRKGHSYTNAYVYKKSLELGCKCVINNDFHSPGDYLSINLINNVLLGLGASDKEIQNILENNKNIFLKKLEKRNGKKN